MFMFKQAVEKLAPSEITLPNIREAIKGVELMAPQGKVRLERENLHTRLWPKIAMAKSDGQFEVLKDSAEWKAPEPYAAYPNMKCTEAAIEGRLRSCCKWLRRPSAAAASFMGGESWHFYLEQLITGLEHRLYFADHRARPVDHLRLHGRHQRWRMASSSCSAPMARGR